MSLSAADLPAEIRRQVTKRVVTAANLVRRVHPQFGYRESDIVMSGFQKSGNNWVGFLIANTLARAGGKDVDIHFRNLNDWFSSTFPRQPPVGGFPRLMTTHDPHLGQRTRAIYVLRHPADVMESYHHYLANRWNEDVGEFSAFLRDEAWGVPAWRRHVTSWEGHWDVLVQFEELKDDPLSQLREVVSLLDRDLDESVLEYAVEQSSFERMRRMEEEYGLPVKHGANPDYRFMRKGESDQGADYFEEADYRYLWETAGEVMERYGYDVPI